MCSAHRLTERNIGMKFNQNRSKGSGDMEWTRKCYGRNNSPRKHTYMGPIWATLMEPIWGVQPGSAWVPYGLSHMRVAQMGPI